MKRIKLTQGKFAIVDNEDYEELSKYKWRVQKSLKDNTYYATRAIKLSKGKYEVVLMHRQILGLVKGDRKQTDHINHNGLDNKRDNIRICTHAQNQWNQQKQHKGICWYRRDKKWVARIRHNGNRIYIGAYNNEIEGSNAYQQAIKRLRGAFTSF